MKLLPTSTEVQQIAQDAIENGTVIHEGKLGYFLIIERLFIAEDEVSGIAHEKPFDPRIIKTELYAHITSALYFRNLGRELVTNFLAKIPGLGK